MNQQETLIRILNTTSKLMQLHGQNAFRARAYEKAADAITNIQAPISEMTAQELANHEGVGEQLARKIVLFFESGVFEVYEKLMYETPKGVMELMNIKGLGIKKIQTLWKEHQLDTPEKLLEAAKNKELQKLKGFGKKTEENLHKALLYYLQNRAYHLYAKAESEAAFMADLLENVAACVRFEFVGDLARKCDAVKSLSILCEVKDKADFEAALGKHGIAVQEDHNWVSPRYHIPLQFFYATEADWVAQKIHHIGSTDFVSAVFGDEVPLAKEEKAAFEKANHPFLPPEMREAVWAKQAVSPERIENLIRPEDLKGAIHNHSTYSDGKFSIAEMAKACQDLDLQYFGIADHSQTAYYAGGLKPETLVKQIEEVDALNEELAGKFKVFTGIESDILKDGSLDYEDELLAKLDYVVASVHAGLDMNQKTATERLLKAIEHPQTNVLGHVSGRLLLIRSGYPYDVEKVVDACIANKVAIEINANPRRLDMDWENLIKAYEKGAYFAINPDAHHTEHLPYMYYGVQVARKAGITKERVINTFSTSDIQGFFKK